MAMKVRELIEKLLDYDMDTMVVIDTTKRFTVIDDVRNYHEFSGKAVCLDLRDAVTCHDDVKDALELLEQGANEAQEVDHDQYSLIGSEDFDPKDWVEKSLAAVQRATA